MGRMVAKSGGSGRGVNQAIERVEAPAGSEDATLMMARVQQHQGQASYVVFGTQLAAGHHNENSILTSRFSLLPSKRWRAPRSIFPGREVSDAGNLSFYRRCD